jgi:hypothetical protein
MQKGTNWLKSKKLYLHIRSAGILLIPVVLYLIPLDWLKNQQSICLFKFITGKECYGCGISRAVLSALHFHFDDAFTFNRLFVIVLPILIYLWVKLIWSIKVQYKILNLL